MLLSWKKVVIGGEVTVLAAFTGVGIHLAMQPHRFPVPPPAITIPATSGPVMPSASLPESGRPSAALLAKRQPPSLSPELFTRLGREDHHLLLSQWDILQRLIKAIEQYIERKVVPAMEGHR